MFYPPWCTDVEIEFKQNECRRYIEPYTEFCQLLGISPDSSPIVRFYRVILQIYEGSTHCYSAMFDRLEDDRPLRGPDLYAEGLNKLLDDACAREADVGEEPHHEDNSRPPGCDQLFKAPPRISSNQVPLYACSFCSKPSANLRKCGCHSTSRPRAVSLTSIWFIHWCRFCL